MRRERLQITLECPYCGGRLVPNHAIHVDMFNKQWFDYDIVLSCKSCNQFVHVNISYDAQERKLKVGWGELEENIEEVRENGTERKGSS
ncbi:MAG: hypothetical protein J7L51_03960 [Desulfurococcales archaeon]|nr:hypothetical protein [Desulfurococcales archaeon]